MIQLLADKYNRHIAYILLLIFMGSLAPVYGRAANREGLIGYRKDYSRPMPRKAVVNNYHSFGPGITGTAENKKTVTPKMSAAVKNSPDNGGPSQPEMSSFQAAGAGNMVNLFTGDFSYNIPLLDVGGYPVNIFYDGSISMEQDASWVGLGWNINPGNINRNMRGIPDDFNGHDTLTQIQTMKPNKTWGVNLSGDIEFTGIKTLDWLSLSAGASLGVSFNNYLGPALDFGLKGGVGVQIAGKTKAEKSGDSSLAIKINAGLAANANSRYGLTLSPSVSLSATHFAKSNGVSVGLSLATNYNSRSGISALQLNEQVSFHKRKAAFIAFVGMYPIMGPLLTSSRSIRAGTTISFAKPSYIPAIRMPITNQAWSGHFQLGGGLWGGYASGEAEVYGQVSAVAAGDVTQRKPMVGYMYYQEAQNNPAAVMDFTRLNDKEVTSNTAIISAPQYSYPSPWMENTS